MLFFKVVSKNSYVLIVREDRNGPSMSPSTMFCAGNAAMCSLPSVLRNERTEAALHSCKGYVLRRHVNRICARWTTAGVANCQKWGRSRIWRQQGMRVSWLAQLGNFLQKHVLPMGKEEILPQNSKNLIKSIVKVRELNLLDRSSQAERLSSASTKGEKGGKQIHGVLLKAQRAAS